MSAPAHDPRNPEVAPGVYRVTTAIVNCYLIGPPGAGDRGWVLVDTGLPGLQARVKAAAAARFSPGARPAAIVLSHGHFDHVGGLRQLAEDFDAPVYAHPLELPYLDGRAAYPPPDPSVGGGMMAYLSWTYPRGPVDLTGRLEALPVDGTVPGLPGWQWMHTPGHSPGHVSLFHPDDRTLVVGDAFVTTAQESLLALVTGRQEVHRPPAYLTTDWPA
ncbi:MAG TPA: MBL fold metallo-hydrolase, partial [Deinococcales bacterium]|nr:MBL fold metallo-hydrolase [Deinococcales bacterium]